MKAVKFNFQTGWIWDCPRLQRLAMWIDLEMSKSWVEIVKTEKRKRESK